MHFMKKGFILLVIALGIVASGFAQKMGSGSIQGRLIDTLYKEILADATVTVLHGTDSSVVAYTLANAKGEFQINGIKPGTYRLMITYQDYFPLFKKIIIFSGSNLQAGAIYMHRKNTMLQEVIVEAPPIQVKKDTVEFRANAFKTKPNSSAEDLLKKLPGVQIDKDGNVKAQGEDVQKVYVDGKEFFGTDSKMATRNITADMIESVQVFDDMSDQAKFTRIDDGSRSKTLNIKLKKDKRKGYFGRFTAGAGNNGRYQASAVFNRFNNNQRISILAGSNNLNKQSFSFSDIVSNMGGSGSRGGGGRGGLGIGGFGSFSAGNAGITKSTNAGINYTGKWGSKIDITGSYFFSTSDNRKEQQSVTQFLFANDSLRAEDMFSTNKNQNHRFNMRMEFYIDSVNSLLYTPNLTFQHSDTYSYDTLFTRATGPDGAKYLVNDGKSINRNTRDGITVNNHLLYRRRFFKPGRTLTVGWNNSISNSNGNGTTENPIRFYDKPGNIISVLNQNIRTAQKTRSASNAISASYTEPIGNDKLLEFNYAYTNRHTTSDRDAFNFNNGKYDSINEAQTNYFENNFIAHRAGINFRVQTVKSSFQLGSALEFSGLNNHRILALHNRDTTVNQKFTNFFPTANFNYNFSRTKSLRVFYRGRTSQPGISQMQDVPDISNPLRVTNGNPGLKQEFTNNFNISYHTFNVTTFKFLSVNINLGNTLNKIVNSIDSLTEEQARAFHIDSAVKGSQYTVPVNMNGANNLSSFITFGIPLKGKLKGSNINFNNNITYNRDLSLLYKEENITSTFAVTQTAGVNLDIREKLNLGLNASLAYNKVSYSLRANLNDEYYTQTYSADISWFFLKSLVFATDFDYYVNTGRTNGFNQNVPLWNTSLALQLFRKKNGELKFSVNDLLNQNQSITRTVSDNYIQDARSMVLRRYFMLAFTYSLNRSGSNQRQQGPVQNLPRSIQRQMERQTGGG